MTTTPNVTDAEIRRLIGRLRYADVDFNDCEAAAKLLERILSERHATPEGMELVPTEPPFPKDHIAYGTLEDGSQVYLGIYRRNGSTPHWSRIKYEAERFTRPDGAMHVANHALTHYGAPPSSTLKTEMIESVKAFEYRRMLQHVREQNRLRELMP